MKSPQTAFSELLPILTAIIVAAGGTVAAPASAALAADTAIEQSSLTADADLVIAALQKIPNDLDYDDWIRVSIAVKAAAGEAAYEAWEKWSLQWDGATPESLQEKWNTLEPPFQVGAPYLFSRARDFGFIEDAKAAFTVVPDEPSAPAAGELPAEAVGGQGLDAIGATQLGLIFRDYVFVEHSEEFVHLETMERLTPVKLCRRYSHIGGAKDNGKAAASRYLENHGRRRMLFDYTYRPGLGQMIPEPLKNNRMCLNLWRPSLLTVPVAAGVEDVRPFTRLAEHLIVNETDRNHVYSWMAYTLQHQDKKINHGILFGGGEGIGKDALVEPLRAGLGQHNVSEIQPYVFGRDFQEWLLGKKLILGQEFHTFERKDLMNRLKPYLAAPPDMLRVNRKNVDETEVPNIVSVIFTTNHRDAMMISNTDRRFFVVWSEAKPLEKSFYGNYYTWLKDGGAGKVVRWLMSRDLTDFDAQGRAPTTAAKEQMRRATLPALESWFIESMEDELPPFDQDIVAVGDIQAQIPASVGRGRVNAEKISSLLRDAGATSMGRARSKAGKRVSLWAIRNHAAYEGDCEVSARNAYDHGQSINRGTEVFKS